MIRITAIVCFSYLHSCTILHYLQRGALLDSSWINCKILRITIYFLFCTLCSAKSYLSILKNALLMVVTALSNMLLLQPSTAGILLNFVLILPNIMVIAFCDISAFRSTYCSFKSTGSARLTLVYFIACELMCYKIQVKL